MSKDPKELSSHHVPHLTVVALIIVAAAIALANVPAEPITCDNVTGLLKPPERAYGWPLTWYRAVPTTAPGRSVLRWLLVRYSASRLAADVAIWLVLLAGSAVATMRLLNRYRIRWRPRWTTLVVVLAAAMPLVLANMTFDESPHYRDYTQNSYARREALFGWPLAWNWYFTVPGASIYGWDFSGRLLATNAVAWLVTLGSVASLWEWLLHRYRPRLRFSLRTMFAAVTIVSILCAWALTVWTRANEQDAIAALMGNAYELRVKRWRPKWLGLVVPDRFRPYVVHAEVGLGHHPRDEDEDRHQEEILERLGRLSTLRSLSIVCKRLTPRMVDTLASLQQLRTLSIFENGIGPVDIAWLGKLNQLEHVALTGRIDELTCLMSLTRLKSLDLDMTDCEDDEAEMDRRLAPVGKLTSLERVSLRGCPGVQMAHLANLTGLKSLTLVFGRVSQHAALDRVNYQERMHHCFAAIGKITQLGRLHLAGRVPDGNHGPLWVRADDMVFLRGLTNMKSLRLRISCEEAESRACLAAIGHLTHLRRLWLDGNVVSGGVAELAPLTSLEQLTSQDWVATPAWIESLSALKGLRVVRIPGLDGGLAMRTAEAAPRRRAVHSLRQSRPGLVIDGDYNNVWLESLGEAFHGEPFDDQLQDLDSFLDFCPAGQ